MKFLKLTLLLSGFLFISCKTHIYKIKLDPQLYTMPSAYGQKLVGLIHYKKWNPIISFTTKDKLTEIKEEVTLLGGNRILPIYLTNKQSSISDQVNEKSKKLLIKGFVVNDITN